MTTTRQIAAVDWGSVPDWIAALGATSALVFAFLAVRSSQRANEFQAKQIETLERERLQEQASKVVASYHVSREPEDQVVYKIHNASDLPIFDALVFAYRDRTPRCIERAFFLNNVSPGTAESSPTPSAIGGTSNRWIGMLFLDAGSRLWLRSFSGKIRQLTEREAHEIIQMINDGPIVEPSPSMVEKFWQ